MVTTTTDTGWGVRLATFALWALAAASVAYWGLRLSAPAGTAGPMVLAAAAVAPDAAAIARLLGGTVEPPSKTIEPTPVATVGRWVLVGVLVGQSSGGGAALIAVDGQAAKPFRVGAQVADGLVLQALAPRQARLGASAQGPATLTLDMPLRP